MKTKVNSLLNGLFVILALGFAACQGDQGDIGPKGDTGATGTTGATGATGANGTGFDELTQYGNIEVIFSGNRIDDVAFLDTINFIYMPTSGGVSENSSYYKYDDTNFEFSLGRENKGPAVKTGRTENGGEKNNVTIYLDASTDGVSIYYLSFYTDILTSDFKTFQVNYSVWNEGNVEIPVTNYSFDAATGKLKFDFSYTIPADNSNTGHDITVKGKANLIVFESLDMPG